MCNMGLNIRYKFIIVPIPVTYLYITNILYIHVYIF